jgi:DNA-binding transcriptional LysR family regulator
VILNEVQRSIEELRAIEEARFGHVTIGVTQNYANYVVPEILSAVRRERPALRLKVLTGGFLELVTMINTEAIDFGFGIIGSLMQDDGVVVERLRAHQSKVFVRVGHPLTEKESVSVTDLAEADWMMLTSSAVQRAFAAFFARRGLMAPSQSLTTDSLHLIRSCLRDSDAVTILPAEAAARDVRDGFIVQLNCETPVEDSQIGFFHRRHGVLTPQAQFLLDRFRAALGKTPPVRKARTLTPRSSAPAADTSGQ